MIVLRADTLGYCMGVRRAMDLAVKTAETETIRPIYTLGPLIHNPQAVEDLRRRGVEVLGEQETDSRVAGRIVILRAHGVSPALRSRLESLGARLADATCPRVLASQRRARRFHESGYSVVLVGDRNHEEIVAVTGCAPACSVVGSPEEARALDLVEPVGVLAQTTVSEEEYEAVCGVLRSRYSRLEIVDTICPATRERQESLARLADRAEAIVVVGGRSSANTARLFRAARALGKPAWHIETAAELPPEVFGFSVLGLTAGASTPDSIIAEVEDALMRPERSRDTPALS
ncbi:MAG: 4-hydroxy-3-methylbut-2-enyl diphosphate reductase [Treponema sp.]|nr:4-hydroxy-3-methylbut-2-enyl diphosphate reductase [Treponema sp.]